MTIGRRTAMRLKILVADDDHSLRRLVCDILNKQGYETIAASNGSEAIELFGKIPDIALVVLDVMMPGMSGFEALSFIREISQVPILMLTALGDETNEINGFMSGANDYIAKPFSYPIFIARVEALLRQVKIEKTTNQIIGALELQRSGHKVFVSGREIQLNNKEYQLLDLLISHEGIVLERSKILDAVWGYDYDGDDKTINTHIKMLRTKLGICASYIKTVKGTGYVFEDKSAGGRL